MLDKNFRKKAFEFVKSRGVERGIEYVRSAGTFSPTGYSGSGVVVEVGKETSGFKVGDLVAYAGVGHSEIVSAPANFVVRLPENVKVRDAALVTIGSIALQALRRAKVELGESVLVIGLGLVGQIVNQLLLAAGCRVIGSDLSEKKIALARELGLEKSILAGTEDVVKKTMDYTAQVGVDAVIICAQSPSSEIINQAMSACRERGRVVIVGDVGLDLKRQYFYLKELDLVMSRAYGPGCYDSEYAERGSDYPIAYCRWTSKRNMEEFTDLIRRGKVDVSRLISNEFELGNVQSAYETLLNDKNAITVVLRCPQPELDRQISRVLVTSPRAIEQKSDVVNVAVIGTGGISKGIHLPNLRRIPGARIYAVVSRIGVNAKKTAEAFGAVYSTTDYREVLRDDKVSAVLIATHHNLHKEMIIESAKAGKHIYVEKPMAMNCEDVKEIVKTIRETGVLMTVGTNRRYSPISALAKEIIKRKGKPVLINYGLNTAKLPLGHWVDDPIEGGGRIIGETPHFFDLMCWLLDSEPIQIHADCVRGEHGNLIEENTFVSTTRFADGSVASLSYSDLGSTGFPREEIEIFANGTIVRISDFKEIRTSEGLHQRYNFPNIGLYEALANFIEVSRGRKTLELGVEDGARSTVCALKVMESLRNSKPVTVELSEYL
jgi:predicted dehydrogenase/NADPH:quinone reductase-like Zn-dependent oxidoreductase